MDKTQNIIGREKEIAEFETYVKSGKPEFIAVYGRRRVGKTFLINQLFNGQMAFSMTGVLEGNFDEQIEAFMDAMDLYGFETNAIVSMDEIIDYLVEKKVIDDELKSRLDAYYEQYGVK